MYNNIMVYVRKEHKVCACKWRDGNGRKDIVSKQKLTIWYPVTIVIRAMVVIQRSEGSSSNWKGKLIINTCQCAQFG